MMDCTAYRQMVMAEPHATDPALAEHRGSCPECKFYTERLLHFESRLERALHIPDIKSTQRSTAYMTRWFAIAASLLLTVGVAGGLWLIVPGRSLAAAVVTHMQGEPQAWRRTAVPVASAALQGVLRDSHLRLAAGAGLVSYANSCNFRGHQVPHLVIQTASGPVTVMVLVHEQVIKSTQFDEQGYVGTIVPVTGHGSLAVLMRDPTVDAKTIERIAAQVLTSIEWTA